MAKLRGFTVIEVVMALAITGALAAVILASIGTALRNQRYSDATSQAVDYFQGVYSDVLNIANNRAYDLSCNSSGVSTSGGVGRGTSSCLLLGKLLRSSNGVKLDLTDVVATRDDVQAGGISDVQAIRNSGLQLVDGSSSSYEVEWGAKLSAPGTHDGLQFSLLVVRSPVSGVIYSFADYGSVGSGSKSINQLITAGPLASDLVFCVDPGEMFSANIARSAFAISRGASNSSGIQTLGGDLC